MSELRYRFVEMLIMSSRIAEIERQIGAGLIEEVIEVAEGELKVVDELYKTSA